MKIRKARRLKRALLAVRHVRDLAKLLGVESYKLQLLAHRPQYNVFAIPKRDGSQRWIEDPGRPLKEVQQKLNDYLQCVYFFNRPPAAYGFLFQPYGDPEPRNILTNARRHLGAAWLFNLDIEDFFHQVSFEEVFRIYRQKPFAFEPGMAELLASLCCHKERLPMGAPTSPILSNFACLGLDQELQTLADWAGWRYTRFADDLCFSGPKEITKQEEGKIREILDGHGFAVNEEKVRRYGPDGPKQVTGLYLGSEKVELPPEFLQLLDKELEKLQHVIELQYRAGQHSRWVEKHEQEIKGKVNFAVYIMGEEEPESQRLLDKLDQALNPPDEFGAVSWLDFPYF